MLKAKVAAIIQARLGSTRLPGKVLMEIENKPMLWHVVNRLRHCELLDEIIIATSVNENDDLIEKFCKDNHITCFRGSENDVLSRYYAAAKKNEVDIIVRITSDCPLIDSQIVDLAIRKHKEFSADYTSNIIKRTYPRGLDTEVFNFNILEKAYQAADKSYQREHVTVFIHEHPELFKFYNVENNRDLSCWRLTVDEEKDLELVREIYKRLNSKKIFFMKDILRLLDNEPSLMEINKEIRQKNIK
ncbi:MAG: glycosyltransferase family protein [Candidatus Omnitrophota bacterium]|jgi:spore coat polysaccharide biosynthesis protein SpsF